MFFSGLHLLERARAKIFFPLFFPPGLLHFLGSIFLVMMREHDGASGDGETCTKAKSRAAQVPSLQRVVHTRPSQSVAPAVLVLTLNHPRKEVVGMVAKRILCPDRLRRVPKQFSWVDHRLVRDKHVCGLSHQSLAVYLLLVTVGVADGMSYYSDTAIERYVDLDATMTGRARAELRGAGLIAYRRPLHQVLSLERS
jgi:hypothetical protein